MSEAAATRTRLHGYDLARAIAIFGMVLINFPIFFAAIDEAVSTPLAWIANIHFGRAAALFVTLAGAGIALMADGAKPWRVRKTLLLRALFLLVLGSTLLALGWGIDILHHYAFYLALAALLFITAPRWVLLTFAILIAVATLALSAAFPELDLSVSTDFPPGGESASYWSPLGLLQNAFVGGVHPVLPWFAFLLMGMWTGRHDLTDAATRARLIVLGGGLAVLAPLLSIALEYATVAEILPDQTLNYLGVVHAPSPLYVAGAVGSSIFMIALCQAIVARLPANLIVRALIHAGQLALTIYVAHALLGVVIPRDVFGIETFDLVLVLAYALTFCAVAVIAAHLYRRKFSRGPIESLMRMLTGGTPEKDAAPIRAQATAPQKYWLQVLATAALALLAIQFTGAPPHFDCATPALDTRTTGALSLLCPRQSFDVSVPARTDVVFETHSSRDLYLELRRDGETIAQNDDGGSGANARIATTLEPGAYTLLVRPYESAHGVFALTRVDSPPTVATLLPGQICSDSCASARDGECDDGGANSLYAVCDLGSDCGDCGIRTEEEFRAQLDANGRQCQNTCAYANDKECDDGGAGSLNSLCAYGSDCNDCGPREPRLSSMR
ncbi:DUF418 domain-containing protein [Vitreimonas flagellata]|uniref:DUF418 domain-containing protein n=1 Tax=Vitreimonas flagellata TaxID=2560861 RepID=UPI001074C4BD|nr:DUF418 domain-containing protein [Vitreimonas flagellata]